MTRLNFAGLCLIVLMGVSGIAWCIYALAHKVFAA